jgi:hypothetical protein
MRLLLICCRTTLLLLRLAATGSGGKSSSTSSLIADRLDQVLLCTGVAAFWIWPLGLMVKVRDCGTPTSLQV